MRQVFERYLTVTEERALLRAVGALSDVQARRDHAWMRLLRQTGIRVRACSRLTVHHAQRALAEGCLTLEAGIQKGRQGHRVPVNTRARQALRDLLAVRRAQGHAPHPDAPLVVSRHGTALSVRSYQARVRHWCQRAALNVQASPHWFRHTLAKRLVAQSTAQDPAGIVQGVLGHRSRTSTGVYLLPDREDLARALEEAR